MNSNQNKRNVVNVSHKLFLIKFYRDFCETIEIYTVVFGLVDNIAMERIVAYSGNLLHVLIKVS